MKNTDWRKEEDNICLLALQKYKDLSERTEHGGKGEIKQFFCEELMALSNVFAERDPNSLKQHMELLLRILMGKTETRDIPEQYIHLNGLWQKANVNVAMTS